MSGGEQQLDRGAVLRRAPSGGRGAPRGWDGMPLADVPPDGSDASADSGEDDRPLSARVASGAQPAPAEELEMTWVQCDRCDKWRVLDVHSAFSNFGPWYCEMNSDRARATCDAPQEEVHREPPNVPSSSCPAPAAPPVSLPPSLNDDDDGVEEEEDGMFEE